MFNINNNNKIINKQINLMPMQHGPNILRIFYINLYIFKMKLQGQFVFNFID